MQQYSRRSNGIRKTHRKSRNGCLQCKKRHIKCDEQRPVCGDCQRLETACSLSEYDANGPVSPSISSPSGSQPVPTTPITLASPATPTEASPLCMPDLELLYHYINSTVQSFIASTAKTLVRLATHEYVEVAFEHPFVMHTLLACSALHKFSKDRSNTALFSRATYLQGVALRNVHPYVSNLQAEHAIPAFIFSSYTGMFTFAELVLSAEPPRDAIEDTLSCFTILRGTQTIVQPHLEYLKSTWLLPALTWTEYLAADVPADQRVPTQDRVFALIQELPEVERVSVQGAADSLFTFIGIFSSTPATSASAPSPFVQAWPVWVDQLMIEIFHRRDPVGMVLLAHYAALMALRPEVWWTKGWPPQLFSAVERVLGGQHADVMEWPRRIVLRSVS